MLLTRRDTLKLTAGLAGASLLPPLAGAQEDGDSYPIEGGEIVVRPVRHASLVLTVPGMVIYADPVGGAAPYEGLPRPNLVLVTHEHGDHFDPATLAALVAADTRLVTNPAVHDKLPEDLKARATPLANGETTTVGEVEIEAIPAYNMTQDRTKYHPKGRDNGYVLTLGGGGSVYIAGDTEDTSEMRALSDILVAFVPMNLPFTMSPEQAARGVAAFAPDYVYPYHYKGSDPQVFADALARAGAKTKVVLGRWYEG